MTSQRLTVLTAALLDAQHLLERINAAFYGAGTSKALRPVMAETKPTLAVIRAALGDCAKGGGVVELSYCLSCGRNNCGCANPELMVEIV
jgi:hypothetical protein